MKLDLWTFGEKDFKKLSVFLTIPSWFSLMALLNKLWLKLAKRFWRRSWKCEKMAVIRKLLLFCLWLLNNLQSHQTSWVFIFTCLTLEFTGRCLQTTEFSWKLSIVAFLLYMYTSVNTVINYVLLYIHVYDNTPALFSLDKSTKVFEVHLSTYIDQEPYWLISLMIHYNFSARYP